MVTFYIGSVGHWVEKLLLAAGIPIQSVERKLGTYYYKTNIQCKESGPFSCSMVVCMHPVPRELLEKVIAATAHVEPIHDALVHIGDPSVIGIKDINRPDYGEPPNMEDKVPVFWASSVTAHLAVRYADLPLAFTDDTQHLFVCDTTIEEFLPKHPPVDADTTKPRLVTLKEEPFVASVLSEDAASRISCLETEIQEDVGKRGIAQLHIPDELVKAALVLSRSTSVAIHFGFPCNTSQEFPDENDGPPGAIAIGKAVKALGKNVAFIARSYQVELVRKLVGKFLGDEVTVLEFAPVRTHGPDRVKTATEEFLFHDGSNQVRPKFDALVAIEATSRTDQGCYMTMKGRDLSIVCKDSPVDELFIQARNSGKIATIGIGDGGNEIGMGKVRQRVIDHIDHGPNIASSVATDHLITAGVSNWGGSALAAALFILNQCPVHSRYTRRGAGNEVVVSFEDVLNTLEKEEEVLSYLDELGVCDGISQWKKMSVDGQPFDPVHKDKLQKLLVLAASSS